MVTNELPDNRLIDNRPSSSTIPPWIWLALVAIVASLLWGGGSWVRENKMWMAENSPFLQVTNREFSLFLWQFPEFMRINVSEKSGYLPGFQYMGKVAMESGKEEEKDNMEDMRKYGNKVVKVLEIGGRQQLPRQSKTRLKVVPGISSPNKERITDNMKRGGLRKHH